MHKKLYSFKTMILLIAAAGLFYVFTSRHASRDVYQSNKLAGLTMGTIYHIEIVGDKMDTSQINIAKSRIDDVLNSVDMAMSTYKAESELSRFNVQESCEEFEVSECFARVAAAALDVARASGGAFDPTVGPLVDLWGFGSKETGSEQPTPEQISEALKVVGYQHLSMTTPSTLKKSMSGLHLDLSALAKGASVDMVLSMLNDMGYPNVLVEVGGEIAVSGHNKHGYDWKISIETPNLGAGIGEGQFAILALREEAVATSGDYRNYRKVDGGYYTHVIDPRTGWPVSNHVASVTVVAGDCMTADALATTLMVLGAEEGMDFMTKQYGADAMIIVRNGNDGYRDYRTPGFDRYVYGN